MLELTGLKKNYGEITALDGVSLRVGEGEKVALLGPNGAGKTTLLSIALGLLTPDAGAARLFGRPPREALAAGRVGVLLQDAGLPDDVRVGDLVAAVAGMYPTPSILADPELEALAGRRVMGLSGGQRQLVRFALALAGDPALLILDEPTVGLDVDARRSLWRQVSDRTVVFATHYLAEADDHADRVVLLSGGRVVADGPVGEMKALVGGTEVRLTLDTMDERRLRSLPGVHDVLVEGATATLRTGDSDATLRALFAGFGDVRNVRTSEADLESVFVSLTGKGA
ncbi:ABC transporter ATP-binding protein [Herbidospora sp. NBRC 101105]|uniref:ABC transporter ATP-binding protein n=1 Tax=Herbidospora sp. NBRC 101105 TaxID=3032195 RepID=UPI0024A3C7E4|nr:ABC transporter ATP-binding protein [Herbidospora sp. NBRC 101105]GLX93730.1 ABC transporter ATP-binding protein [Herbidospora sp. NBRC 101105]